MQHNEATQGDEFVWETNLRKKVLRKQKSCETHAQAYTHTPTHKALTHTHTSTCRYSLMPCHATPNYTTYSYTREESKLWRI